MVQCVYKDYQASRSGH